MKQLLFGVLLLLSFLISAQETDSVSYQRLDSLAISQEVEIFTEISTLDPNRAAIYSAVLPGLGQIYNGQYWKVPIIYGGFLVLGHFIRQNDRLYQTFQSTAFAQGDSDPNTVSALPEQFTSAIVERQAERYRRDRDYMMIITGLFYLLNIADAHISAHLHEFTINKDLALDVTPSAPTHLNPNAIGMALTLRF